VLQEVLRGSRTTAVVEAIMTVTYTLLLSNLTQEQYILQLVVDRCPGLRMQLFLAFKARSIMRELHCTSRVHHFIILDFDASLFQKKFVLLVVHMCRQYNSLAVY
jgi:hypothetical protein